MFNLLVFVAFIFSNHPLHVSTTEIEYSKETHSLQIISRIFIDDLELSIQNKHHQPNLDILNPPNGITTNELVKDYMYHHLNITLNYIFHRPLFLGYEKDGVILICYFEVENIKSFNNIEVLYTIMTETYNNQSNIVHVTHNNMMKSVRLTRKIPSASLTF